MTRILTPELSGTETAVADYLRNAGVVYEAFFTGPTKRDNWDCDSWKVTFSVSGKASESFDFYTGTGHRRRATKMPASVSRNPRSMASVIWKEKHPEFPVTPCAASVLYSVIMDSTATEQSFADWCSEFGYDTDSRKAMDLYLLCQANSDKLHRVFNPQQVADLRDLLDEY